MFQMSLCKLLENEHYRTTVLPKTFGLNGRNKRPR